MRPTVVAVSAGECIHPPHDHPPDHFDPAGCNLPPGDWPDRWQCPTCKARGYVEADVWDMNDPLNHLGWVPCPDCEDGTVPAVAVPIVSPDGQPDGSPYVTTVSGEPILYGAALDGWWPITHPDGPDAPWPVDGWALVIGLPS